MGGKPKCVFVVADRGGVRVCGRDATHFTASPTSTAVFHWCDEHKPAGATPLPKR